MWPIGAGWLKMEVHAVCSSFIGADTVHAVSVRVAERLNDESDDDELHDLYDGAIDPEAYEGDHHRKRPAGAAGAARDDPPSGGEHDDSGGIVDDADYMAWAWQRRVASDRHSLEASRGELAASAKQKWRRLRHVRKAAARATGVSGFFSGKDQAGDAARLAR